MIEADSLLSRLLKAGISDGTGTPCSYLKPFYNSIAGDARFRFLPAHNEGDAVALAAGLWLGGRTACVSFQNSGLGNAVNPLASLCAPFKIPLLLFVTHRGRPGGAADEPQHHLMGSLTEDLLERLGLEPRVFLEPEGGWQHVLQGVLESVTQEERMRAIVLPKGAIRATGLPPVREPVPTADLSDKPKPDPGRVSGRNPEPPTRESVLTHLLSIKGNRDLFIATTGYTARELYAMDRSACHFYMAGSMGCAAALGLGVALAQPGKRVIVLDGDGALLMRLGNLALVGSSRAENLVHVVFDNGVHESTGGQATLSGNVDFPALATASGYRAAYSLGQMDPGLRDSFWTTLGTSMRPGPVLIHIPIRQGVRESLPRPEADFPALARRFRGAATAD